MDAIGEIYRKLKPPTSRDVPIKYLPVHSNEDKHGFPSHIARNENDGSTDLKDPLSRTSNPSQSRKLMAIVLFSLFFLILGLVALTRAAWFERRAGTATSGCGSTITVPQYFQTTPQIFTGPTATGEAPFLAASNLAPFGASRSFVANAPLETAVPIAGNTQNASIFRSMGHLSPYFPNPSGFGVDEFPLPPGASITQLHMLHRHGSRYPTSDDATVRLGKNLSEIIDGGNTNFTGGLSFLNSWSYGLGAEILVPNGRQELFDSGVLHYYNYGHLYNTSTKIIARTTTQDRMLKSAEYFMAGFFGLEWPNNATLELIIEEDSLDNSFNNSLAGYLNCPNSKLPVNRGGTNASKEWQAIYLKNATQRLQSLSPDSSFEWNISSTFHAQTLCPYETVAYGYSSWCSLFTYPEWLGFEYAIDLSSAGNNYFQSPTGRAVGIGYVQEVLARLHSHLITSPTAQDNITLDNNTTTFPLNQTLYFDFSHDTNIAAVLTAFGLRQFAPLLPAKGPIPEDRDLLISHLQPFAARLDIEVISTPHPVPARRTHQNKPSSPLSTSSSSSSFDSDSDSNDGNESTNPTKYIHFLLNQRTIPLGKSFPECGDRSDGWCALSVFLDIQDKSLARARWEESCFGKYESVSYGDVKDGVPIS